MSLPDIQHETALIQGLKAGEDQAFADLYDNYGSLIYGVIYRIVKDDADAENVMQDCFVKIWERIKTYDPKKGKLATWLINVSRNAAIDFTRSKYYSQKNKNQSFDNFVYPDTAGFITRISEDTMDLREKVGQLKAPYREIIEWLYFEGYTQQEISDQFDIPLGTVKTRTRKALQDLRAVFSS